MLFNSPEFIFIFLPITLLIFFQISNSKFYKLAIPWLTAASFFFYGCWNPYYLILLISSILFNYFIGIAISRHYVRVFKPKYLLILSVLTNLCLLGYFKYMNFFLTSTNEVFGTSFNLQSIVLPLAISFSTFNQIAYLVDTYRGEVKEHNFFKHCLFISFFPHLIAGPIVHHGEMIPQLDQCQYYQLHYQHIAVGISIFSLGLFKKVVFADSIAVYANPVFDISDQSLQLTFFQAWVGAIAYSLQLYFDFSGYSDMAIGTARMFGIKFPLNFNSPYKAVNIIDFWRRWHMTLSRFLKDYLYIPLGGNRKGKLRRYLNLMITMLLGGLWHGAAWNFAIWGGLHGVYLIINHQFQSFRKSLGHNLQKSQWWSQLIASILTFLAVLIAWVFFRANNINTGIEIIKSMSGTTEMFQLNPFPIQLILINAWINQIDPVFNVARLNVMLQISFLLSIVWITPNTQQWMGKYEPALDYAEYSNKLNASNRSIDIWQKLQWKPSFVFSVIVGILIFISTKMLLSAPSSEFLYFSF
ncbi:MBOAT family O-acyltransferase [Nostoc sp.]|uniref:MBOAT family O-acyltransferase n=1 Tax=Nostoc sp. TaxID=1180 RepID=UPI002FF4659E